MQPSIENRFYDLLGRKLAGESTAAEQAELESILQNHPELQPFYNQLLTYSPDAPDVDIDNAYENHRNNFLYPAQEEVIVRRPFFNRTMVTTLVAASTILVLGLTWLFVKKNKPVPDNKQIVVSTGAQKDARSVMTLPDGSVVRLNAMSKVSYAEGFANKREVYLEGEAYFEVAHNENIPFIVHTGEADIKVLGTRFNVRNYANEHRMEAALLTGSIELTLRTDTQHSILLKPSDKIIVKKTAAGDTAVMTSSIDNKVERTSIKMQDSVIVETSWLNDKLAFYDKPFAEIALDLERKFDVHIEFKNEAVSGYKFTGVYDENNAEDILKILQMIKSFQYTITNNQIIIY
jgi:transmembrane sensor